MPILRPPPPSDADRCTRSEGRQRCKNLRLRRKPFCRLHLPASSPKLKKRKYVRVKARGPPPTIADLLRRMDPPEIPARGEIWAAGHESDGIPRSYARIERVGPDASAAEVTRLDFHPISDEEFAIVGSKLPISCGTFRAASSTTSTEITTLCHRIGRGRDFRVPGLKSFYRIFPRKGEIWAIYRDSEGSERTPLFRIVEVLQGFTEKEGVSVVGLEAVEGSKTEFRRRKGEGSDSVYKFSKMELVLFSHRVTGIELVNKGAEDDCDGGV